MLDTYSEEYRHLCECQHIMSMEKKNRLPFIKAVEAARGKPAADKIKETLMDWKNQRMKLI